MVYNYSVDVITHKLSEHGMASCIMERLWAESTYEMSII